MTGHCVSNVSRFLNQNSCSECKVFLSHPKLYPHLIKLSGRGAKRDAKIAQTVPAQTEPWPEDLILGPASRWLAFALYDTTDENLVRHSCCFLRDKIKEKQGSNLLSLCVALSPTLRLCAQIRYLGDRTEMRLLCAPS